MPRKSGCAPIVAALALSGCAASVTKNESAAPIHVAPGAARQVVYTLTGSQASTGSADWESFKGAWFGACKPATEAIGAAFASSATPPRAGSGTGTSVIVFVDDYRYRPSDARYGFGLFTNDAFVDAKVEFRDLASGSLLGQRRYGTSSSAWQGMFSAMTDKQLDAICGEIAGEIKPK